MGSPTAIDLFAGGGGAALGLRLAGFRCVAHVEWDPLACETLRAAVASGAIEGDVLEGDIRAVDWTPYVGVDLAWASPPCQAWSSAGQRLGAQDERNGWPWTWDAVDAIRPKWLICENVGGLLHHLSAGHPERPAPVSQMALFGAPPEPVMVRDDTPNPDACARCYWDHVILAEARKRFAFVDFRLIDCADLGVPQHRERLILVCGPEPYRWPVPTHRDPKLVHAVGKPWVTVREALGVGLETIAQNTPETARGGNRWHGADEPAPTVSGMHNGLTVRVEGIATAHGPGERVADRATVDLTDSPARTVPAIMSGLKGGSMVVRSALPQSHAEDPGVGRAGDTLAGSEPWRLDQPSAAVTATEVKGATPRDMTTPGRSPERASGALWLATGRRRLTTAECAALQSFPPDWPWRGTKTAIYRQIGNAVPPLLAQRLAALVSANCASGARRAA